MGDAISEELSKISGDLLEKLTQSFRIDSTYALRQRVVQLNIKFRSMRLF